MRTHDTEAWSKVFEDALPNPCLTRRPVIMRSLPTSTLVFDDLVGVMPTLIAKAINTARLAAKREHIKADRIQRVNLFTNALRTRLCEVDFHRQSRSVIVSYFCMNKNWYDIGVLSDTIDAFNPRGWEMTITPDDLNQWVDRANNIAKPDESMLIQSDMDELRKSMAGVSAIIEQAKRINSEADAVVDGLVRLGDEIVSM